MTYLASVITDARIYVNNKILVGTGDVTLPDITYITAEVSGGGLLGPANIPTYDIEACEMTIVYRALDDATAAQASHQPIDIEVRANQQRTDMQTGVLVDEGVAVFGRCRAKSVSLGSLIGGQQPEVTVVYEMLTMRLDVDRRKVFRMDKLNRILEIIENGAIVDVLAQERANL